MCLGALRFRKKNKKYKPVSRLRSTRLVFAKYCAVVREGEGSTLGGETDNDDLEGGDDDFDY